MKIKEISAGKTYLIRKNILRNGIDLPYKFKEDFDEDTFHLGAYDSDELVGIATFIKNKINDFEGDQYQLRGMATLEKGRGKGFGKQIINEAKVILKQKNVSVLWCNARKEAVMFYKKLNFTIVGEEFNVVKVGLHYKMYTEI